MQRSVLVGVVVAICFHCFAVVDGFQMRSTLLGSRVGPGRRTISRSTKPPLTSWESRCRSPLIWGRCESRSGHLRASSASDTRSNERQLDPLAALIGGESKYLNADGTTLHYVQSGPTEGPLVILLHGFPDFWWTWRAQIPALNSQGYCTAALDMRGYHLSSKPQGLENYRIERLCGDVAALIRHLTSKEGETNNRKVYVVGHDWGGCVAWALAKRYPTLLHKLAILNSAHPAFFLNKVLDGTLPFEQLRRSWYIFAMQIPTLGERVFTENRLRRLFRSIPFSEADVDRHVAAFVDHPGSIGAAINYYRAALVPDKIVRPAVRVPVLILWGDKDKYLVTGVGYPTGVALEQTTEIVAGASHWVQHDQPDVVSSRLASFFAAG